jgi:hypothetical protein
MTQNSRPEHRWSSMEAGSHNEQKLDQSKFMKIPFTGGCACGAIRYESTAEPVLMLHCHCRDCQRSSGGPFSSFVIVPEEAFKLLQGSPRFHASPSARGGKTNRGFCSDCGSPIMVKTDPNPDVVAIRTASLDDPSWFNLQMDTWTSDAHPWDQMNPVLPKYERYPTS